MSEKRQYWIDNLRTAMICLVVSMHACVTYSHLGSWYYNSPPKPSIAETIPFVFWQAHLQSFFMGLLFFVGGYFADRSLTHRGTKSFLYERVRRLGIPVLIYMFVLDPVLVALVHPGYQGQSFFVYIGEHLPDVSILGHTGPMWFALALLIFSVILVLMRGMMPAPSTVEEFSPHRWVWLGLALGVVSFLVRLVQPVGSSILNMQLCYFTQYVVLFALGVVASRRNILEAIATSKASWRAGLFGVLGGPVLLLLVLISLMPLNKDSANAVNGGWNYHALASAVWEQVTGVGLCLGAIWLFRQKLSLKTPLSTWLSDRSFAVYLIHPVVLVSLCYWVQPWRGDAILMSLLTTVGALAASFGLADMLRRIPGLRWVL